MIRKRIRRVDQIECQLQKDLKDLGCNQQFRQPEVSPQLGSQLDSRAREDILTSLERLHRRIDKLQNRTNKQNTTRRTIKTSAQGVLRKPSLKMLGSKPMVLQFQSPTCNPRKSKVTAIFSGRVSAEKSTASKTSYLDNPNDVKARRKSSSSVRLLEQILEGEMTALQGSKQKQREGRQEARSAKKLMQQKIGKLQLVIANQRNMEGMYKNLEWQARGLAESLTETRGLCCRQKQQLHMYKSKLRQSQRL